MTFIHRKQIGVLISLFTFFMLACNATFSVGTPSPTNPAPTEALSPTAVSSISQQVTLTSVPFNEENPGSGFPSYKITAQIPQLTGRDDPRVLVFNQRLNELVTTNVDSYRYNFEQLPITPISNGSFLNVTYTPISQINDLWSLKFDFSFYADTAAHPGLNSVTLNYDLGQGRELALGDIFLSDSNYLETISNYCIAELRKQPYADVFTDTGTQPTLENYRNWNITPDGLLITFDAYQVAPGAAGPQHVNVPYDELIALIDPQGPLGNIAR